MKLRIMSAFDWHEWKCLRPQKELVRNQTLATVMQKKIELFSESV